MHVKPTSAVLYARYSPRRKEETDSGRNQLERCREEARRRGLAVRSEHVDQLASGADPKRVGLWDAVASIRSGDVLLAESSSRLARDTVLLLTILDRVKRLGGAVVFVDGGEVEDTPTARMVATIIAAVSAFEREEKAALTRARMRLQQRQGRLVTRPDRPPYGYRAESGRLVAVEAELAMVARMTEMRLGGDSHAEIAATLNAEGATNRGRAWRRQDVGRILKRNLQVVA